MGDTASRASDDRRKAILDQIQTHEEKVLTTSEVADGIHEVGRRQVKRNLEWMHENGDLNGRQIAEDKTWLWWVSADVIPADDSVASAMQIGSLLATLYNTRWEFRVMGFGVALLGWFLSLSVWGAIFLVLGIDIVSTTTVLSILAAGFILCTLTILFGIFIFPVETFGNWPAAVESGENEDI